MGQGRAPEPGQAACHPGLAQARPRPPAAGGQGAGGRQAGRGPQLGGVGLGGAQPLLQRPPGLGGHLLEVVFQVLQQQVTLGPGQVGEGGPDRGGVAGHVRADGVVHAASSPPVPSSLSMASVNDRQVPVEAASRRRPASLTA